MRRNPKRNDPNIPNDAAPYVFMVSAIVCSIAALCYFAFTGEEIAMSLVVGELLRCLILIVVGIPACVLLFGLLYRVIKFLNRPTVETRLHLLADSFSRKLAMKNAAAIYPCLQNFLFFVLSQHKEELPFSLGRDASSLLPRGYLPAYRSGCVFYRFQVVAPEAPNWDMFTLRLVVQNYITGELMNYGVPGLAPCYNDTKIGILPSIFIDRIFYDEAQAYLTFDVLYVCTQEAAEYVSRALHRDNAPVKPEKVVFDDDV